MDSLISALHSIGIFLMVLMIFNLMIVVHEWGHFLAARWRNLKIDAFQIWFGKPIWKKTINGVQYGLGTIPFGGFVKLPQMVTMEAIEGKNGEPGETLPPISPLDKIIVAFAGPLFSFLLAVTFACLVAYFGKPEYEADASKQIGYIVKDSPAEKAGLKPGDDVISIDDKPVRSYSGVVDSIKWMVVSSEGSQIKFQIVRPGEGPKTIEVEAKKPEVDPNLSFFKKLVTRPPFRMVGIGPAFPIMVSDFMPNKKNTPAQQAGFEKGDRLVSINGTKLYSPFQLGDYLAETNALNKPQELEVIRHEKTIKLTITPRIPDEKSTDWNLKDEALETLGLQFDFKGQRAHSHPSVFAQINDAARTISQTLKSITSPKSDLSAQHLSSVVGIVHTYTSLLNDPEGILLVLWFSVVLNVNLAILNLLPFPVLDGGHIVMALVEAIRRRPMNLRILEYVQATFVVLLLGLMVLLTMKDTGDLFGASQKVKDGKQPEPKNEVISSFK